MIRSLNGFVLELRGYYVPGLELVQASILQYAWLI